ncbi:MAG: DUF2953 domain-containing protein [Desulfotomaculaceae bacterium]|nr:DUF2953 domain-containing protein [Desulfotomaculaceae bacterium]
MGRAYLLVILAIIFLLVIFLAKMTMRLSYRKQGRDDRFALGFTLWHGLIHYKLEIPIIKMQPYDKEANRRRPFLRPLRWLRPAFKIKAEIEGKEGRPLSTEKKKVRIPAPARVLDILHSAIIKIKRYHPVIVYLFRHIKLSRFHWQTEIGAEDPSQTGILTGTAWGIKGFVLSFAYQMFAVHEANPVINVTPNFKKACFNTSLDCIFEVRIGYIIFTSLKALAIRLK